MNNIIMNLGNELPGFVDLAEAPLVAVFSSENESGPEMSVEKPVRAGIDCTERIRNLVEMKMCRVTVGNGKAALCSHGTGHVLLRSGCGAKSVYTVGGKDSTMSQVRWTDPEDLLSASPCTSVTGCLKLPTGAPDWITAGDRDLNSGYVMLGHRSGRLRCYDVQPKIWQLKNESTLTGASIAYVKKENQHRIQCIRFLQDAEGAPVLAASTVGHLRLFSWHPQMLDAADEGASSSHGSKEAHVEWIVAKTQAWATDMQQLKPGFLYSVEGRTWCLRKMDSDKRELKEVSRCLLPDATKDKSSTGYRARQSMEDRWVDKTARFENYGFKAAKCREANPDNVVVSTHAGSLVEIDPHVGKVVSHVQQLSTPVLRDFSGWDNTKDNRLVRSCYEVVEVMPRVFLTGVEAGGAPLVDMRSGKKILRFPAEEGRVTLVDSQEEGNYIALHSAPTDVKPKVPGTGSLYFHTIKMAEKIIKPVAMGPPKQNAWNSNKR